MSESDDKDRRLSVALLIAVLCVPSLFGWLVLRKGYPRSLRHAVLIYGGTMTAIGMIGRFAT